MAFLSGTANSLKNRPGYHFITDLYESSHIGLRNIYAGGIYPTGLFHKIKRSLKEEFSSILNEQFADQGIQVIFHFCKRIQFPVRIVEGDSYSAKIFPVVGFAGELGCSHSGMELLIDGRF